MTNYDEKSIVEIEIKWYQRKAEKSRKGMKLDGTEEKLNNNNITCIAFNLNVKKSYCFIRNMLLQNTVMDLLSGCSRSSNW